MPFVDSGYHEDILITSPCMEPSESPQPHLQPQSQLNSSSITVEIFSLENTVTSCCLLYHLWVKKHPSLNTFPTLFSFSYQPFPENLDYQQDKDFMSRIKSPYSCNDWFPEFVQHVSRILKRSRIEITVLMVSILYIGRLRDHVVTPSIDPSRDLTQLLIAALIFTQKIHSDVKYSTDDWTRITGYSRDQIILLERDFLYYYIRSCKFSVTPTQYSSWLGITQSLQDKYSFVFKAYGLSDSDFALYVIRVKKHRPGLLDDIIANRELTKYL